MTNTNVDLSGTLRKLDAMEAMGVVLAHSTCVDIFTTGGPVTWYPFRSEWMDNRRIYTGSPDDLVQWLDRQFQESENDKGRSKA